MLLTQILAAFLQFSWWIFTAAAFILAAAPIQRRRTCLLSQMQSSINHHAGVLPLLQQLECGDSIIGYRITEKGRHNVTVERVASSPPIFVLRDFVTDYECNAIQSSVTTMDSAQTASGLKEEVTRKNSFVAWLGNDEASGLIGRLADAGRRLMLLPGPFGVEDMQVVRYGSSGEYKLHHDGNDRILTVLYYLNGEGETWFPLARTGDEDISTKRPPQTRQEALYRAKELHPGVDGILVSASSPARTNSSVPVNRGDAVAFFSYLNGSMDWNAVHSGLPARSDKIVANHFFRYDSIANVDK